MTTSLQTVKGAVDTATLGIILPHEHLFVDLRGPFVPGYAQADPDAVVRLMLPVLQEAVANGVTAVVDCGTVGVGRNLAVYQRLADSTPIHLVIPTGVYKDGFIPTDYQAMSVNALADLWTHELTTGIEGTTIRAGFIKIALVDEGPTPAEVRNLQAAARASQATGAVIASHTIGGAAARRELDILEAEGLDLHRFIWVHAHTEADSAIHREAAQRGAWLEFDAIGALNWFPDQGRMVAMVHTLIEAGYTDHLLLSHDAGWYDPAAPDGVPPRDGVRGYAALFTDFLPALRRLGVDDATIHRLLVTNPARAFGMAG